MPADKSNIKTNVEIISLLFLPVLKPSFHCVLEKSCFISDYGPKIANRVFAPNFETFYQLLTSNDNVVINWKEDLWFSLFGDVITPIHRVVLSCIKIDWYFPLISFSKNPDFLHGFFIIPDYADLIDNWALHKSISFEVLHELWVIACSGMSHCDQTESYCLDFYVVGTSFSAAADLATRIKQIIRNWMQIFPRIICILL
jgi:hypothetical protein